MSDPKDDMKTLDIHNFVNRDIGLASQRELVFYTLLKFLRFFLCLPASLHSSFCLIKVLTAMIFFLTL